MIRHALIVLFFLSALAPMATPYSTMAAKPEFHAQVITVRNCDELAVRHKAKIIAVRIAGIDCPGRKQQFALESKSFVGQLVNKHTITVKPVGHDRHRRVWANVFLPDGRSLAYEMVKAGWAQVSASVVDERLTELEQEAQRSKRGLWDSTQPVPSGSVNSGVHRKRAVH